MRLAKLTPRVGHASDQPTSCTDHVVVVRWADLPLACPFPGTSLWNGHPRVYLPIFKSGRESCTYCGTIYVLEPPVPSDPIPDFANSEIEESFRRALLTGVVGGNAEALGQQHLVAATGREHDGAKMVSTDGQRDNRA